MLFVFRNRTEFMLTWTFISFLKIGSIFYFLGLCCLPLPPGVLRKNCWHAAAACCAGALEATLKGQVDLKTSNLNEHHFKAIPHPPFLPIFYSGDCKLCLFSSYLPDLFDLWCLWSDGHFIGSHSWAMLLTLTFSAYNWSNITFRFFCFLTFPFFLLPIYKLLGKEPPLLGV